MTVLVCGSRTWTDRAAIATALEALPRSAVVIHGAARGADTIAGEEAARLGLTVRPYPADWRQHGRAAGAIRNQRMLDLEKPDRVIAFWRGASPGTGDMVTRACHAGVRCDVYDGTVGQLVPSAWPLVGAP